MREEGIVLKDKPYVSFFGQQRIDGLPLQNHVTAGGKLPDHITIDRFESIDPGTICAEIYRTVRTHSRG